MITIVLIAAGLIAALLIYAATRPASSLIKRSASIEAPPERIFPLINDLRRWTAWSPYEMKDPAMKRVYSGASSGRGSVLEFDGNREVGAGRVTITDASTPSRVSIALDMLKPFRASNTVEFVLVPRGFVTDVTWAMSGGNSYLCKVMGVFINMDRMIGRDFETGLANLKAIAENRVPDGLGVAT